LLIYIIQPEYWRIEVAGCQSGIGLPQTAPYHVAADISHVLEHDPEKWVPVFPRDKRGTRLRGDHAQTILERDDDSS